MKQANMSQYRRGRCSRTALVRRVLSNTRIGSRAGVDRDDWKLFTPATLPEANFKTDTDSSAGVQVGTFAVVVKKGEDFDGAIMGANGVRDHS